MEQTRLDAIRARCEAATPGPWTIKEETYELFGHEFQIFCPDALENDLDPIAVLDLFCGQTDNAAFIAAARTDVPDLLAEVARLTAELAAMTVSRDEWQKSAGLHFHKETDALEKLAALKADRDAWRRRAEAAEQDLANAALCENCIHADNDECSVTCGDSDSAYRWEWRGPGEDEPNDTKEANHADE